MKEALFYEQEDGKIKCLLCPKECTIAEGKRGFCQVRENIKGKLYALTFGECSSVNLDPIEKKPLYHFYPGSSILSLGSWGCNLSCQFCQNWSISQNEVPTRPLSPPQVVKLARNSLGIAYTYNEPLIWYEYVLETAKLAKKEGLKNVLVTNGFINEKPLTHLLPYIDALNIDLKSFNNSFYKKFCQGELNGVLKAIELAKDYSYLELTNLIVPGLNDQDEEINDLVNWVYSTGGEDLPLHFSCYFPNYKISIPATPVSTLRKAKEIAQQRLKYVYLGNVWEEDDNTYCPNCKETVIKRRGYQILGLSIEEGKCKYCGERIEGRFK